MNGFELSRMHWNAPKFPEMRLESVTRCYKVLQGVTRCYKVLQGVTGFFVGVFHLSKVYALPAPDRTRGRCHWKIGSDRFASRAPIPAEIRISLFCGSQRIGTVVSYFTGSDRSERCVFTNPARGLTAEDAERAIGILR